MQMWSVWDSSRLMQIDICQTCKEKLSYAKENYHTIWVQIIIFVNHVSVFTYATQYLTIKVTTDLPNHDDTECPCFGADA